MQPSLDWRIRWRLRRFRRLGRMSAVWLRHRGLRSHDVVLDEYPKSGSTWLAFMLGEFLTGVPIDFVNQREYMPAVGAQPKHEGILPDGGWLLRSHEPAMAEYGRSVYLVRHVADVAVSYFNYLKLFGIDESPREFLPAFLRGHLDGYGSWADHVHSWLDRRGDTLVVRYEDLRADPDTVLGDVVAFLGVDADPPRVEHVVRSNTFDRMREKERRTMREGHEQANSKHFFVNRGVVGASLHAFSDDDFGLIETLAGSALHRLGYEVRPAEVAGKRA